MSNVEKSAARDQWSLRLMFAGVASLREAGLLLDSLGAGRSITS